MECPRGAILECAVQQDAILSLGQACCCPPVLCSMTMSLREFWIGYLDGFVGLFGSHF